MGWGYALLAAAFFTLTLLLASLAESLRERSP